MWPLSGGVFRNRHVLHPQQPTPWEHQTIMPVSEQHFPKLQQSSLSPCPLQIKVLFVFSSHFIFLLFFISLPNLSHFSPILPGSLYLLRAIFLPFFLFFDSFPLGVIESPNDLFSSLSLLSLACFYELLSCSLLVPTQALWSLFILFQLFHILLRF